VPTSAADWHITHDRAVEPLSTHGETGDVLVLGKKLWAQEVEDVDESLGGETGDERHHELEERGARSEE